MYLQKTNISKIIVGFAHRVCKVSYLLNTLSTKPITIYILTNRYVYMTSIRISDENRKKLNELKTELDLKNVDEVITHLLEVNEKFKNKKVVSVIEWD